MKKLLLASIVGLLSIGVLEAGCGWGGRSCSRRISRTACPTTCPATCPTPCPEKPMCCKTIKVPYTAYREEIVEVPAREIRIPQPDQIEYRENPAIEVRTPQAPIPQPDIITYKCVPPTVIRHKQPDCIRYECPTGCTQR